MSKCWSSEEKCEKFDIQLEERSNMIVNCQIQKFGGYRKSYNSKATYATSYAASCKYKVIINKTVKIRLEEYKNLKLPVTTSCQHFPSFDVSWVFDDVWHCLRYSFYKAYISLCFERQDIIARGWRRWRSNSCWRQKWIRCPKFKIPDEAICISHRTDTFEKGMHPIILRLVKGK